MRRTLGALGLCVLLLASAQRLAAQSEVPETAREVVREQPAAVALSTSLRLAGPIDPEVYRVGPGDRLAVVLSGRISRVIPIEIDSESGVILPGVGTILARGLTLAQLRDRIFARLKQEYVGVQSEVRLTRPRTFRVSVIGRVASAGTAEVQGASHASDLLTQVTLASDASRRNIILQRRDGSRIRVDLERFTRIGERDMDPWLEDGDVLIVPVATSFMFAHGAFAVPGRIERVQGDRVSGLVALAGGLLPSADSSRVWHVRWRGGDAVDSIWIPLPSLLSHEQDPEVGDAERVYVYFQPQYRQLRDVSLIGEVQRPGSYPIREGITRLTELVAASGGFTPEADLAAIRIFRRSANAEQRDPELDRLLRLSSTELTTSEYSTLRTRLASLREEHRVNWTRLLEQPAALDVLLRDGDVVRVDRLVNSVRVDGEVRRPGILSYRSGRSTAEYIREAGGLTNRAWASKMRVIRAGTGQTMPAGSVAALEPGDFIWIPERPDRNLWDQTRDILTVLTGVATVIIAVRSIQ